MKAIFVIIIALLAQLTCSSSRFEPIQFDLQSTTYQQNTEWTSINLQLNNFNENTDINQYQFYFDVYPQDWKYVYNSILIPTVNLRYNRKYPIRVRVVNSRGMQVRATIVVLVKNTRVSVSRFLYPYDAVFDEKFYNNDGYFGRPLMVVNIQSSLNNKNPIQLQKQVLQQRQLEQQRKIIGQLDKISNSTGSGFAEFYQIFRSAQTQRPIRDGDFSLIEFFDLGSQQQEEQQEQGEQTDDDGQEDQDSQQQTQDNQDTEEAEEVEDQEDEQSQQNFNNQFQQQQNNDVNKIGQSTDWFYDRIRTVNRNNFSDFANGLSELKLYRNTVNQKESSNTNYKYQEKVKLYQPNSSVFKLLPSTSALDSIILSSSMSNFSSLIQQVSQSQYLNCQQKSLYLNVFLGKIHSAIKIKEYTARQLQILNEASSGNVIRLNQEIKRRNKQIQQLKLTDLKDALNQDLDKIKQYYSQFNGVNSQFQPLNSKILQTKSDVQSKKKQFQIDREQLIRQKLQYNQANLMVQKSQQLLSQAKKLKYSMQQQIYAKNTKISQSESIIEEKTWNIGKLQYQLTDQKNVIDKLKIQISEAQIVANRVRTKLATAVAKEKQIQTQLYNLEDRMRIEKRKLVHEQIMRLQDMISGLQKSLPSIQEFIGTNYFNCFKADNFQMNKQGDSVVYIVGASDFQNYIQNVYQLGFDWTKLQLPQRIRFRPLTIMDRNWQSAFGLPYDLFSFINSKQYSFYSDFNCLSPSSLKSGTGVISKIESKHIDVQDQQNGTVRLKLGACSRLQSTSRLPQIGQRLYWKGVSLNSQKQYNVYRMFCL